MAINSQDQLLAALSAGQTRLQTFNKTALPTTAQVAGLWYDLFGGGGNPGASTLFGTGTNLTFQAVSETTSNASSIPHGGDVSSATKHLLNASIVSASASSCPAIFQLIDIIAFFPITTVTTTGAQTLLGTQTLPRYTNGDGVQAYLVPSTVMGAGTPTCTLTYTNSAGTGSKTTPSAPTRPTLNSAAPVGSIPYSGTGAGKYGPFIPLAAGDAGVRSVESINFSTTMTSGVMNLVLCKPIGPPLTVTTIGVAAEREFISQLPSLPQIPDGACLSWMQYAGVATPVNTSYFGTIQTVWN